MITSSVKKKKQTPVLLHNLGYFKALLKNVSILRVRARMDAMACRKYHCSVVPSFCEPVMVTGHNACSI